MKSRSTELRLGLFAIGAIVGLVVAALALGWSRGRQATLRYETFFDESVQGLDVGSPVKYRGVRIGSVSDISIAPDRKHVGVGLALAREDAMHLGLGGEEPHLRAQLAMQGITGVKFIDIDVVTADAALPTLPFAPGPHYIPSRPSLLVGLQGDIESVVRSLPALVDRGGAALDSLRRVLDEIHDAQLGERIAALADDVRQSLAALRKARVPETAASLLARLRETADKVDAFVASLTGADALIASARRATETFGDLGRDARGSRAELDRALRELADAARSVRELAELIERDPDALLRGRTTPRGR